MVMLDESQLDSQGAARPKRKHVSTKPPLLTRDLLDGRTNVAKAFDQKVRDIQADLAGRDALSTTPPGKRVRELWCVVGRRGGKSRVAAALAVFLALFTKHKLAHGERGMVLVLAASIEQARVVFGYAKALTSTATSMTKQSRLPLTTAARCNCRRSVAKSTRREQRRNDHREYRRPDGDQGDI